MARAQGRVLECYVEYHHIIPSSLGGTNDESNKVALTAREHYIAHLLLVRMVEGQAVHKMSKAAWLMACRPNDRRDYKVNSKIYQTLRLEHAKTNGLEERRKKTSESMKRYQATNPWTPERRERQRVLTIERMKAKGLLP